MNDDRVRFAAQWIGSELRAHGTSGVVRSVALLVLLLVSRVASARADHLDCEREPALVRLAGDVLDSVELPTGLAVQQALCESGSDLPNVSLLRYRLGNDEAAHRWFDERKARRQGRLVCGMAKGGGRVVLVVGDRLATLVTTRSPRHYRVSIEPEVRSAYGFALMRNGQVRHAPVEDGGLTFDGISEPMNVQVVGHTRMGPLPLAQWTTNPTRLANPPGDTIDLHAWHAELHHALFPDEHLRRAARKNRKLTAAAAKYAAIVCNEERVAHTLGGKDAIARVAEQGLQARDIGEVLVRAPSLSAALDALLQSASHRLVLLDPRMTDVGFGVRRSDESLCVVGLFASWPRPLSTGAGNPSRRR